MMTSKRFYDYPETPGVLEQQRIASEILDSLHLIDRHAIIAGGAPRDWRRGQEANDIDYYISIDIDAEGFSDLANKLFGITTRRLGNESEGSSEMYSEMTGLKWVREGIYKGQTVQFINMHSSHTNLEDFSCSVCEYWCKYWRKDGDKEGFSISMTRRAYLTEQTDVIFFKDELANGRHSKHMDKMRDRFRYCTFVPNSCYLDYHRRYDSKGRILHPDQRIHF